MSLPPKKVAEDSLRSLKNKLFSDILQASEDKEHLVAFSVATGLFWCFTPTVFFQQAAICAYWVLVKNTRMTFNLPIAWAWTWWSNPLTLAPLYYAYYVVGGALSGEEILDSIDLDFSSFLGFINSLSPYILQVVFGSLLFSVMASTVSYVLVRAIIKKVN